MIATEQQVRLLRFGDFEVDLRSGELRKGGVKLKFGGQPFLVLSILLERPGDVVTREEMRIRLWPDTFVDVDHNLNAAVNKIRGVLGDSAESPRFVETLPRRGYRFIGELHAPVGPTVPAVPLEPVRVRHSHRVLKIAASVVAISALAVGAEAVDRWHRQERRQEQEVVVLPGQVASAAFSPDGSRIAFAGKGDAASETTGFDLYVRALGSETLLRLTQHPSEAISPVWSPDGTQIAFYRLAGADTGIYVVPALGGPERKLRSTRLPSRAFSPVRLLPVIRWSPDGKWIALAGELPEEAFNGITFLSTETWETYPAGTDYSGVL